jgi:hypothetical protein
MNAATAAGLLGGDVSAKFVPNAKPNKFSHCEFTRLSDSAMNLRIQVVLMDSPKTQFAAYLAMCGRDAMPVKAIGNEAVACRSDHGERIVGRVRDQAFVITLVPGDKDESVKRAAEIVAGNLF